MMSLEICDSQYLKLSSVKNEQTMEGLQNRTLMLHLIRINSVIQFDLVVKRSSL